MTRPAAPNKRGHRRACYHTQESTMIRIVFNKLLGGWYVVRGPHQTPISGRFDTKADAQAWLNKSRK